MWFVPLCVERKSHSRKWFAFELMQRQNHIQTDLWVQKERKNRRKEESNKTIATVPCWLLFECVFCVDNDVGLWCSTAKWHNSIFFAITSALVLCCVFRFVCVGESVPYVRERCSDIPILFHERVWWCIFYIGTMTMWNVRACVCVLKLMALNSVELETTDTANCNWKEKGFGQCNCEWKRHIPYPTHRDRDREKLFRNGSMWFCANEQLLHTYSVQTLYFRIFLFPKTDTNQTTETQKNRQREQK